MFELILLATAVLLVVVLLSRLSRVEGENAQLLKDAVERRHAPRSESETLGALGQLTDEMRHMIVSPLTVVLGQCELARNGRNLQRRILTIERQAQRIAEIVERFGAVGRDHRGDVDDIDPIEVTREIIAALEGLARERDIRVHEMFEHVPRVQANPALLRHALRHLIKTAMQSARRGVGDVTVAIGMLPGADGREEVAIAVADDGPGIPPEQLPRIFHPFPEGAAQARGGGLSYAVVYAVARAMGGSVAVDSAPGAGTRATLKIPLKKLAPNERQTVEAGR